MTESRIAPACAPYSQEVEAAFSRIMPEGVPPLTLFRTVARNERVFLRLMAGGLLDRGSLTLRDREIVIDRTCFLCRSEYEWGVHVAFFGPKARFTNEEVNDLCAEATERTRFGARERLLITLCDELHKTQTVSDPLFEAISREWTAEQIIELVVLAGYYHMISFATNALRLPLEAFGARFPKQSAELLDGR